MGNAGARALARGLPEAAKLGEVYLSKCAIGTEGAVAFVSALPRCKTLALLAVPGNPISAEGQIVLRAAGRVQVEGGGSRDPVSVIFHSGDTDAESDYYSDDDVPFGWP